MALMPAKIRNRPPELPPLDVVGDPVGALLVGAREVLVDVVVLGASDGLKLGVSLGELLGASVGKSLGALLGKGHSKKSPQQSAHSRHFISQKQPSGDLSPQYPLQPTRVEGLALGAALGLAFGLVLGLSLGLDVIPLMLDGLKLGDSDGIIEKGQSRSGHVLEKSLQQSPKVVHGQSQ